MILTNGLAEQTKYEGESYVDRNGRQQWSRHIVWDEKEAGFGLRVTPRAGKGDRRTWVLLYRINGQKKLMKLGEFPDVKIDAARRLASAMKGKTAEAALGLGDDPLAARQKARAERKREEGRETVAALAGRYIERHAKPNKRSWRTDERLLNKEVLPHWRTRRPEEITYQDVERLLNGIVDRGSPIQANRVRALLSKMFAFGRVRPNPARDAEKPVKREDERARDRVLSDAEIRQLWRALDGQEPLIAASYRLRLLTAQRQHEIHHMKWSDISPDGWWTIPREWTKNKKAHRVYLAPQALEVLRSVQRFTGDCEYVFDAARWRESSVRATSRRKDGAPADPKGEPLGRIQYATARVRKAAKLRDFRPHDLRRSAATLMTSRCGVSRMVVGQVLNHSEAGVTKVYDRHSYDPEKKAALEALGVEVERILAAKEEEQTNVLAFARVAER